MPVPDDSKFAQIEMVLLSLLEERATGSLQFMDTVIGIP